MEILSFTTNEFNCERFRVGAIVNSEYLLDFAAVCEPPASPLGWFDLGGPWFQHASEKWERLLGNSDRFTEAIDRGWLIGRKDAYWLAPVPRPGKLICIGLNYRDHAAESQMPIPERPVVFSKFATAVIAPGEPVVLPAASTQVDYEAELAVVIGRRAKSISAARGLDYVLGYTCFNDISARDFQFADGQWQRGKSCDTFGPMGPTIVTTEAVPDPHKLSISLLLNGKTMQDSNTAQLIFGIPELIEFLSQTITLEPGDVIATGTPAGVGFARKPPVFLQAGDRMEVIIEKVGRLNNPVVVAEESVAPTAQAKVRMD